MRALAEQCADPLSAEAARTAQLLASLPLATRKVYFNAFITLDLASLVLCALAAGLSASTSWGPVETPAFVRAAQCGSLNVLNALLEADATAHTLTDACSFTALHAAAAFGKLACLVRLLEAGASPAAADSAGSTPLMSALTSSQLECASALLPVSELAHANAAGNAAIHVCVLGGLSQAFGLLLPLLSDVDVRTVSGQTPLHLACAKGQQQLAKALLKRGASRCAVDSAKSTPLHSAAEEGALSCIVLLVGRPANVKMTPAQVNATDAKGRTPLHLAAMGGYDKVCGVIMEAGALLDVKTAAGISPLLNAECTPVMLARQYHPDNAALLALLSGQGPANPPGTVCDHCGKSVKEAAAQAFKSCSACHNVRYCDAACQMAAWPNHKPACKAREAERKAKTALATSPSKAADLFF